VEGEKTGDGISYASHVKNPNPLKARATTFYDPVHNALDKEGQCAWKEAFANILVVSKILYEIDKFKSIDFSRRHTGASVCCQGWCCNSFPNFSLGLTRLP
jgi:hypothetical protein